MRLEGFHQLIFFPFPKLSRISCPLLCTVVLLFVKFLLSSLYLCLWLCVIQDRPPLHVILFMEKKENVLNSQGSITYNFGFDLSLRSQPYVPLFSNFWVFSIGMFVSLYTLGCSLVLAPFVAVLDGFFSHIVMESLPSSRMILFPSLLFLCIFIHEKHNRPPK